ncbi:MAG: hypothetical protein VX696_01305, partial [Pseudomonadota bacterium]|nr:hypothetical protein [Pseudomonadota bacterium]
GGGASAILATTRFAASDNCSPPSELAGTAGAGADVPDGDELLSTELCDTFAGPLSLRLEILAEVIVPGRF